MLRIANDETYGDLFFSIPMVHDESQTLLSLT